MTLDIPAGSTSPVPVGIEASPETATITTILPFQDGETGEFPADSKIIIIPVDFALCHKALGLGPLVQECPWDASMDWAVTKCVPNKERCVWNRGTAPWSSCQPFPKPANLLPDGSDDDDGNDDNGPSWFFYAALLFAGALILGSAATMGAMLWFVWKKRQAHAASSSSTSLDELGSGNYVSINETV